MACWNRTEIPVAFGDGKIESRQVEAGPMTMNWGVAPAGLDEAPFWVGLPDNKCQANHWGIVLRGKMKVTYADGREEVIGAGQAYYLPPGHSCAVLEDGEIVEFTPTDELQRSMEHAAKVMAQAQQP